MRLNLMHGLAAAALGVAVLGFITWRTDPPARTALQWHEGELVGFEEVVRRDRQSRRWLLLRVRGLERTFRHDRGRPAYDALRDGLRQGARIAVLHDPRDDDETPRAWAVRSGDRSFFDYDDMAAWDRSNRTWGIVLAVTMSTIGAFLG